MLPREITLTTLPWEALPSLNDYVAEGFKTGKFDAVAVGEPRPSLLEDKHIARRLVTQNDTTYNNEFCCLTVIKRAIVDNDPDTAAKIARAFRHAREWAGQHPREAVLAAQAGGYYAAAVPVEASVKAVKSLGFDHQLDVARRWSGRSRRGSSWAPSRPIRRRRSWSACTTGSSSKQAQPAGTYCNVPKLAAHEGARSLPKGPGARLSSRRPGKP